MAGDRVAKTPKAGDRFREHYTFIAELGKGAMGTVWEAKNDFRTRPIAIKLISPAQNVDRERLRTEVEAHDRIDSKAVVRVYEAGIDEEYDCGFIVMDRVHGRDLAIELDALGKLPWVLVLDYVDQICAVLDLLRDANVVHRDLKPSNLMVETATGRIKVMDFGVAKLIETMPGKGTLQSGTPAYWSPEQSRGDGSIDHRADLFALGQVVFELLVGRCYPKGTPVDPEAATVSKSSLGAVALAASEGVQLPDSFDAWFRQATADKPNDRFNDAWELATALKAVFEPPAKPRRGLLAAMAMGATAVLGAIVAVGYLWFARQAQVPPAAVDPQTIANETRPTTPTVMPTPPPEPAPTPSPLGPPKAPEPSVARAQRERAARRPRVDASPVSATPSENIEPDVPAYSPR